jgi:uncharacterized protein YceK
VNIEMMSSKLTLALMLTGLTGCGTMANLDGREYALISLPGQVKPRPFGGVARDAEWMLGLRGRDTGATDASRATPGVPSVRDTLALIAIEGFFVVDLPFSLVGDIVTLPKTIPYLWMDDAEYSARFSLSNPPDNDGERE